MQRERLQLVSWPKRARTHADSQFVMACLVHTLLLFRIPILLYMLLLKFLIFSSAFLTAITARASICVACVGRFFCFGFRNPFQFSNLTSNNATSVRSLPPFSSYATTVDSTGHMILTLQRSNRQKNSIATMVPAL